jgi:hypothetical protein
MANTLFYYFGDDEAYFRTLMGEFKTHTRLQIEFKRVFESDEKKIQSLFIKIFRERPACVFIDFSKHSQDYMHLARLISRTPMEQKPVTVGLVDYLSPPEIIMESNATGVMLTHIKSPECYDVIFDVAKLLAPNEIGEHGFANAALKEEWDAGIPLKVGYVHGEGLHMETDCKLNKGDKIRLNHGWTEKRVVPSHSVFIQNISTKNLFYHFKYAVDAEFLFIDEFLPPEGMELDKVEEKKQEREDLILYHKKQLHKWLVDNASRSLEKKAKVLIVDRNFHFFNDQERTDKHNYTVRCLPYIDDIQGELDRLEPQVIAFALDREDETDKKNTNEILARLMNGVKNKIQDQSPFVIVFNTKATSKELQDSFSYAHIMGSDQDLSVDIMLRMADKFEKKLEALLETFPKNKIEPKVFLKKTNTYSIAEIVIPVKVSKISETDMILTSDFPLQPGMNIHLKKPVEMFVNIQPTKDQGRYHGLIHCLGESEKKELRRFVNSVFFRDHDAQVNAESEEFKKLNEAKLQEKQEALKKAIEEAQAKKVVPEEAKSE